MSPSPPRIRLSTYVFAGLLLAVCFTATGCASSAAVPSGEGEQVVVEGTVSVRGNEPFSAPVLETPDNNYYVLVMEPEMRRALVTPGRVRVTGTLYLDEWNGRPFAHLRVATLDEL